MRFITLMIFVPLLFLRVCPGGEVVVYTSEDKVFSEPILQKFEKKTGIKVRAIYDTEETKSAGLVNRLIAEKDNPQADVFWSGDPVRPVLLEMRGITTPYISSAAADIPKIYMDEVGDWRVVTDNTAPSKPNVLAQLAKNSGSIFNLALISDTSEKDADFSARMKAIAGDEDQGGGLVWRAKDANNYYVVRYNPLENNYRVYKVVKGKRTQLQSADIKYKKGWHTLRATMVNDLIECYYDGKKYLEVKDLTFPEVGRIGLWTKADAQTYFDDLMVSGK